MLAGLAAVAAVACSDRSDYGTEPIDEGEVKEIVISNFAFTAPAITIAQGTTVRWRNATGTFHTVTPDGHQAFAARQTNSQGQTFQTRFDTPGIYKYFCEPHRTLGMTGEIVVQ
jgi:plastocyanin